MCLQHLHNNHKKTKKSNNKKYHDSWSSRASSILKQPESIYVSRQEVLNNLQFSYNDGGKSSNHSSKHNSSPRIHDSWSSRASSILAKGMAEPNYMSRTEMLEKLAQLSHVQDVAHLEAMTAMIHGEDDNENDDDDEVNSNSECSEVSTVKQNPSSVQSHSRTSETNYSTYNSGSECSCESCAVSYSSCSCSCDEEHEAEEHLTSMTSSVETIIEGRDKGKIRHTDVYVVNGSDNVSEQFKDYDPIPKNLKAKQTQLKLEKGSGGSVPAPPPPPPPPRYSTTPSDGGGLEEATRIETRAETRKSRNKSSKHSSWSNAEFTKMYEPVGANEIRRQRNAKALKQYLQEFAADWDDRVHHLNTLRRGRVLKELKRNLRETIDLETLKPEDLGDKVVNALRQALDTSFEALSNVNIGHMYVPMEENPSNSKAVSRENTDYDTFGSIDSLIFEPKVPTNEAIQEEIETHFDYLNSEFQPPKKLGIIGPGKTTFAERVKMFNNLSSSEIVVGNNSGGGNSSIGASAASPKQPTNWHEVALAKKATIKKSSLIGPTPAAANAPASAVADSSHITESTCPECRHVLLESLVCSTCDNCTQCGEADLEAERKLYDESNGGQPQSHQSQQVLVEVHQEDYHQHDHQASSLNKVSYGSNTSNGHVVADENQLRRQLKQAFGQAKPAPGPGMNSQTNFKQTFDTGDEKQQASQTTHIYEPIAEHNVEYDVDFLSEYAQKTSLYHVEVEAAPVLSKHGHTMAVTEDMFRGDIEGTLKKVVRDLDDDQHHYHRRRFQKGASPELNNSDSGIASPPPDDEFSLPTLKLSKIDLISESVIEEENDVDRAGIDSGMDDSGGGSKNKKGGGGQPKRPDTMIRELKSRLKERRFAEDEDDILEGDSNSNKSSAGASQGISNGTVESRKIAMGPQFAKLFANKPDGRNQNLITVMTSNIERPELTNWSATKSQQTHRHHAPHDDEEDDDLCSDCGEPLEEQQNQNQKQQSVMAMPPTREMLYAPGGLFGPKGPFSTPHVRYPNGMEMPPRKASRAPSRISAMKTPNPYSEIGSVVAEDRSVKSSYAMNAMIQRPFSPGEMSSKPPSRMETYRADWEELPFEDLDKWQEEKAKRMLAWIHTLHGSEHIGTETPWWKV